MSFYILYAIPCILCYDLYIDYNLNTIFIYNQSYIYTYNVDSIINRSVHEQLKIKRGAENLLINWVKVAKELNRSNVDCSNKWGKYLYLDESYVS